MNRFIEKYKLQILLAVYFGIVINQSLRVSMMDCATLLDVITASVSMLGGLAFMAILLIEALEDLDE